MNPDFNVDCFISAPGRKDVLKIRKDSIFIFISNKKFVYFFLLQTSFNFSSQALFICKNYFQKKYQYLFAVAMVQRHPTITKIITDHKKTSLLVEAEENSKYWIFKRYSFLFIYKKILFRQINETQDNILADEENYYED